MNRPICCLKNGRIINVFSGEIETGDIAISGDRIAGIGSGYQANKGNRSGWRVHCAGIDRRPRTH